MALETLLSPALPPEVVVWWSLTLPAGLFCSCWWDRSGKPTASRPSVLEVKRPPVRRRSVLRQFRLKSAPCSTGRCPDFRTGWRCQRRADGRRPEGIRPSGISPFALPVGNQPYILPCVLCLYSVATGLSHVAVGTDLGLCPGFHLWPKADDQGDRLTGHHYP